MSSIKAPALRAALTVLAALSATACASTVSDTRPLLPTMQYTPQVTAAPAQLLLAQRPNGLSADQQAAVTQLVADWRASGGGPITIESPVGSGQGAAQVASGVETMLRGYGLGGQLAVQGYEAGGDAAAPVRVTFMRYMATIQRCGLEWPSLTSTAGNEMTHNFGCANTANLSAMIANPADLVTPRQDDPSDATRRGNVMSLYRVGAPTASAIEADGSSSQ